MTRWIQTDPTTHILELNGKPLATVTGPPPDETQGPAQAAGAFRATIDWSLIPDAKPRAGETLNPDVASTSLIGCKQGVHGRLARHRYQRHIPRTLDSAAQRPARKAPAKKKGK